MLTDFSAFVKKRFCGCGRGKRQAGPSCRQHLFFVCEAEKYGNYDIPIRFCEKSRALN